VKAEYSKLQVTEMI